MKIYSISIYNQQSPPTNLCMETELSSYNFFQRQSIQEFITFFSSTLSERIKSSGTNERQVVEQDNMVGYVHVRQEGISTVLISDKEYPKRVAFQLMNKIGDEFVVQIPKDKWIGKCAFNLNAYITKYQDPKVADPLMRAQNELDETKIVMHKTIESVLKRGEKLDDLVSRSEQLSAQSKMFYKSAKKTNSCCRVM